MKELLVPIDLAGRIVLPKKMRQELAIKAGDRLKVAIAGTMLTLTPARRAGGLVRKGTALVFSTGAGEQIDPETVDRVLEACREESGARIAAPLADGHRGK
jgi:AbrB family looped-hinge helix DNA binding protein